MTFTASHAALLLPLVSSMSVADAHDRGLLEAIGALIAYSKSDVCALIINCRHSKPVAAIKAIRMALECSLKEAKDMYDRFDPRRDGGHFVVLDKVGRDAWEDRIKRINNDPGLEGVYFTLM